MSKRKAGGNFLSKNLGRFVEKAGQFGLENTLDVANGGGSKSKPGTGSAAHKATDWASRPATPAPSRKRRSR